MTTQAYPECNYCGMKIKNGNYTYYMGFYYHIDCFSRYMADWNNSNYPTYYYDYINNTYVELDTVGNTQDLCKEDEK